MNSFWQGFEKRANKLKDFKSWYTKTQKSPIFKAKKALGYTALAAAPILYGAHQLAKPPEPMAPEGYQPPPQQGM